MSIMTFYFLDAEKVQNVYLSDLAADFAPVLYVGGYNIIT